MYTLTYLSLLPHLFGLAHAVFFATHTDIVYDVTDTDCSVQNGSTRALSLWQRERERGRVNSPSMSWSWKLSVTPNFRPSWGFFKAYVVGLSDSYETSYEIINLSLSLSL